MLAFVLVLFHIGHFVCFSLSPCSRSIVTMVFIKFSHLFDIEFVVVYIYALCFSSSLSGVGCVSIHTVTLILSFVLLY